jgi:transposase
MTEMKQKLKETTPDAEVVPRAKRRQFSVSYKLQILEAAEQCHDSGEVGALLRREGLYSSHLSRWRQLRRQGQLGDKGGRGGEATRAEVAELRRENERLQARLVQAELVIDVQKKISQLLGLPEAGKGERE